MPKRKPPETDAELLAAFADLFDEIEMESDEDTDEVLRAAGYDLAALDSEIRAIVDETVASSPLNWRNKQAEIAQVKERFNRMQKRLLSRPEMETTAKALIAKIPQSERPAIHFRNFEEMTDEDLASWLIELNFLIEDSDPDKDSDVS